MICALQTEFRLTERKLCKIVSDNGDHYRIGLVEYFRYENTSRRICLWICVISECLRVPYFDRQVWMRRTMTKETVFVSVIDVEV